MDKNEQHHKRNKMFFIIEKEKFLDSFSYHVHKSKMYDLTTAIKKMLALDTLNEDTERYSYHLQEVNFSMVTEPLILTDEVKNSDQEELPF
jgi:hypothetical protein